MQGQGKIMKYRRSKELYGEHVITSYSIHYTKLYELGLLRKDEERVRMVAELKRLMEQSEMSPLHKETILDLLKQVERL